jgi:hypothetical protein
LRAKLETVFAERIALNQLQKETTHKNGVAIRRHTCGWDNEYLLKVLAA